MDAAKVVSLIGSLWPLLALAIVLLALKEWLGAKKRKRARNGEDDGASDLGPPPYELCASLLTENELRCFRELLAEADPDEHVLAKVRLVDFLEVPDGTPNWKSHFNRVAQKRVDFVVCDRKTMRVKALIELDDASHARRDRRARDAFLEEACAAAGVRLVRVG